VTFFGIDPAGLANLGTTLEHHADAIVTAASRAMTPLERHGRGAVADRIGTGLTRTGRTMEAFAADFPWRIDAVRRGDQAPSFRVPVGQMPISQAELAIAIPLGAGPPRALAALSRRQVRQLSEKSPAAVAAYFAGRTKAQINLLVVAEPELMTDLDGAPPWARYAASDLLIGQRIAYLKRQAAAAWHIVHTEQLEWLQVQLIRGHVGELNKEVVELTRWLDEDRQILLFDPDGDGRVVEVFGDLATAVNIGVVVPGITNDRSNFSDGDGGFRANARNIHDRAEELDIGSVATVAWLGYDTPDGADALLRKAAGESHGDLVDFVAGLDALDGRHHITVVGHSYGSLVTGMAAKAGLAANEVVFVGSPGTSLSHASEANLKPGGVVWAGLAYADPIGAGVDITEFLTPQQQFRQTMRRLSDALDGELAIKDLHHGTNPAHEDFGAIEIHTEGSTGHSDYFKPDTVTLDNLLYIIAGMDGRVSIEIPDVIEIAPGPIGEPWEPVGEIA